MRFSFGGGLTVQQTERWFSELRAGRCFARGATVAASVGNFSEVQLFNTLISGVQILVYKALGSTATANAMQLRFHNASLATLSGVGINLHDSPASGVGELRTANPAALDGTAFQVLHSINFDPIGGDMTWVAELDPGDGILITSNIVNEAIAGTFYWNEV